MKLRGILVAALTGLLVAGCGGTSVRTTPIAVVRGAGNEGGMSSGSWGDGGWLARRGIFLGYREGRRWTLLFTIRNRSRSPLTLLTAGGVQPGHRLILRVGVQVRLAPLPPRGDLEVVGLRPWSVAPTRTVEVPAGREAWVQFDFVMRDGCRWFDPGARETVNRGTLIRYQQRGQEATTPLRLAGDQVTVTMPAASCGGRRKAFQRVFADVYDGRLDQQWPCSTTRDAIEHLPADPPTYSEIPTLLERHAKTVC
jgi:hypothetical protein